MQFAGFLERLRFLVGWGMPMAPLPENAELRVRARLAWNGWPDSVHARKILAETEARDPVSAASWDRVVAAVRTDLETVNG